MLELSLSRCSAWDASPEEDEAVDMISVLERPSFDILDYLNWCRFLDRDLKKRLPLEK